MKTRAFQAKQAAAKKHLKTKSFSSALVEGVHVPHVYDEPPRTVSYWDDFGFRLGSQWVTVWWRHPRMELVDKVEEIAWELLPPDPVTEPLNVRGMFTPNTVKVGKSRKKVQTYTMLPQRQAAKDRFAEFYRIKAELLLTGGYSVTPSIEINQYRWGRGVSLCYPIELLSQTDVVAFSHQVKAHMKGEIARWVKVARAANIKLE